MAAEMKHGPIALIDSENPNSSKGRYKLIKLFLLFWMIIIKMKWNLL